MAKKYLLTVTDSDNQSVFSIDAKGTVEYMVNGEKAQVTTGDEMLEALTILIEAWKDIISRQNVVN